MSRWCHSHRPGECTALGHHGFGERSTCEAPERSLDWSEVVRRSLIHKGADGGEFGLQQLQSFSSAHPVAWGWSPGVLSPHRSPASTLAVSQGFLAFSLCNLVWNPVVLACKRTSVPPPIRQEARGRSKGKSTRAKYRAGKFPASRLQLKASPPKKKILGIIVGWEAFLSLLKSFIVLLVYTVVLRIKPRTWHV